MSTPNLNCQKSQKAKKKLNIEKNCKLSPRKAQIPIINPDIFGKFSTPLLCDTYVHLHVGEFVGELSGAAGDEDYHFDLDINGDTLIVVQYFSRSLQRYLLNFDEM